MQDCYFLDPYHLPLPNYMLLLLFSHSVGLLQPQGLQHTRPPCPSPSLGSLPKFTSIALMPCCGKGACIINEALSHAVQGHLRQMGHSREVWQNVILWRTEWQTTPVYLPWEPHELYKMPDYIASLYSRDWKWGLHSSWVASLLCSSFSWQKNKAIFASPS